MSTTMGSVFSRDRQDSDASDRSFRMALDVVNFLRDYVSEEGIFRYSGNPGVRQRLLSSLMRGDEESMRSMLTRSNVLEAAAALQAYIGYLDRPLIPPRVQHLLISDNPGVPEERVASDALGLLYQDLKGVHLELMISLLELFHGINANTRRSELTSVNLPITLLPTFFNVKKPWSIRWKQVASTFNELIMKTSPAQPPPPVEVEQPWPAVATN